MHKSNKQTEIFEFIKSYINIKGYPPSIREICLAVGLRSTSTVYGHLQRLERKGLIKRDPTKPRTIEILQDSNIKKETINIPIVKRIISNSSILDEENIEDIFPLPINYIKNTNELFMLRINDESMIDIGMLVGDFAIAEKTSSAKNGEIVVTLIENEGTIKRFFEEKDFIKLKPENKNMKPIIVPDCEIVGKVIGMYRQYA